jgi:hypothetical protein
MHVNVPVTRCALFFFTTDTPTQLTGNRFLMVIELVALKEPQPVIKGPISRPQWTSSRR